MEMRLKKNSVALVFMASFFVLFNAHAQNESDFETDGNGTITAYNGQQTSLVIPDKIGEEQITAIGDKAFLHAKLISVVIPHSVTSIGNNAFGASPKEVSIGSNVMLEGDRSQGLSFNYNGFDDFYIYHGRQSGTYVERDYYNWSLRGLTDGSDISVKGEIYFVGSFAGLDLREEPCITGKTIKKLPQYTKLEVIERLLSNENNELFTVDELKDYWYKVDIGNEIGWVFGAYLTLDDGPDKNPEKPVLLGTVDDFSYGYLQFPNLEGVSVFGNRWWLDDLGTIKVYDNTSKEANFKEPNLSDGGDLFKVSGTDEWLYLLNHGFVFIYDLPSNDKRLQKYPNIGRRHGPLLEIYCSNKVIKFWDDYSYVPGTYYGFVGYHEEDDEVVIYETQYEREPLYYSCRLSSCDWKEVIVHEIFSDEPPYYYKISSYYRDKYELIAKLAEAKELEEKAYTAESWAILLEAVAIAKAIVENQSGSVSEADEALNGLIAAIEQLEKIPPADAMPEIAGERE